MKKTYFITLISFLYVGNAFSATPTCEQMPTCEDLGYADADSVQNCKRTIGCPFDATKVACIKDNIIPTRGYCKIGDVFYSDLTCGDVEDYYDDGVHIPVGVVFMLTDEAGNVENEKTTSRHGKVIALDDLGTMQWSESNQDLAVLTNYTDVGKGIMEYLQAADGKEGTSAFFSGKSDTKAIIDALPDEKTAAKVAYEYYPSESLKDDPYVGQGQWYLPSAGEMVYLISTPRPTFNRLLPVSDFSTSDRVEAVLQKLGKSTIFIGCGFFVTTEEATAALYYPSIYAEEVDIFGKAGRGYWHHNLKKKTIMHVRPILAF